MKKIYITLGLAALIGIQVNAQTQRFQIVEEFTGENCGPCASINPGFDATWDTPTNASKMTTIKYQGDIPSAGPVLYQQTSVDVDTRMGYYSINSHPDLVHDGKYNKGNPSGFTQAKIDGRYSVTSPFKFDLTHSFDATYTNIIITGTITATQPVTYNANQLKQHIVIIEREINFTSPPGSNGEKDFKHVVRKMLPSASGTNLPTIWVAGQSVAINIVATIPSFIYKLSEVAVVGFIQNNADKEIQQGVITPPVSIAVDASVQSITGLQVYTCASSVTPSVVIKNDGTVNLTSLDINYTLTGGGSGVYNWTGTIASGATSTINLPAIAVGADGSKTITFTLSSPNASIDPTPSNNSLSAEFIKNGSFGVSNQIVEDFSGGTFPPSNWNINNPTGADTWQKITSHGGPLPSVALLCYGIPNGEIDEFYLPSLNLSGVPAGLVMSFSVAYAKYNASSNERLQVKVSSDCGVTWATVYDKAGTALSTAANTTSNFAPSAAQFRTENFSLNAYVGKANVLVKFVGISNYGNNMFIDNINIVPSVIPPTISNSNVQYCENEVVAADALDNLVSVAPAHTKNWYTTASGGVASAIAPVVATTPTGVTTYYVSSLKGAEESGRLPIIITIISGAPATPAVAIANIQYCNNAVASALLPNGNSYVWYTDPSTAAGMSALITPSTAAQGTTTYYLAEKNACGESATRATVNVTVDAPIASPTTTPVSYCQFSPSSSLTATGTALKWYTASVGGIGSSAAYTPSTVAVGSKSYYVSQTIGGCESPRVSLSVTIKPLSAAPSVSASGSYCEKDAPASVSAVGTNILWYVGTSTVGSASAPSLTFPNSGVYYYYATQNTNTCESSKAVISLIIKASAAVDVSDKLVCYGGADYTPVVSGTDVVWYTTENATSGSSNAPLIIAAPIRTYVYYVSQTVEGCESVRKMVTITVDDCTGIDELAGSINTMLVSPNPASNHLTIKYVSDKAASVNLTVTNIIGEKMISNENIKTIEGTNTFELNNMNLVNGIYFVNLDLGGNKVVTKKIIINK